MTEKVNLHWSIRLDERTRFLSKKNPYQQPRTEIKTACGPHRLVIIIPFPIYIHNALGGGV